MQPPISFTRADTVLAIQSAIFSDQYAVMAEAFGSGTNPWLTPQEASLRLPRILAIFGLVGFAVPIASYLIWWLTYASGLGKILDDWNYRAGVFMSAAEEIYRAKGQVHPAPLFDYVFWDVLWVAFINVPLYIVLGSIWWTFNRHKKAEYEAL